MRPNKTLINAFRSVADKIEKNPNLWNWGDFEYCNCGLLAKELGVNHDSINNVFGYGNIEYCSWGNFGNTYKFYIENCQCKSTGLEIKKIVNTLLENGIEMKDLEDIESKHFDLDQNLQGEKILARNFREIANDLEKRLNS